MRPSEARFCRSCEVPLTLYNRAGNGKQCETCDRFESHDRDWALRPAGKEERQ